MSRLSLVAIDDMQPAQREQYDRFPSNLTRGLLLLEQGLAGTLPSSANALRSCGLDAKVREGIILRVAALSDCAFERMQHLGEAGKAGWTPTEIAAIEGQEPFDSLGAFAAVLGFVDACVASPRVPDDIFAAARTMLSDRDLATVIVLIGHYMTVARFVETLGIELDPAPSDWTTEH